MRLSRTHMTVLLGVALIIGAAVSARVLLDSPSPAQTAAETLERNGATVSAEVADAISPQRPLVIVIELFQRGGYKAGFAGDEDYMYIYDERVTSKQVITPDAEGRAANITEELSNLDGSPPIAENLLDGTRTVRPVGVGADDGATAPDGESFHVADWLNAQLSLPKSLQERGYEYAGRFEVDGQPNIRYELRETVSSLPNGQEFDPPLQLLNRIEFVEANPLLGRESHYRVMEDGALILDYRQTIKSVTAGEPPP